MILTTVLKIDFTKEPEFIGREYGDEYAADALYYVIRRLKGKIVEVVVGKKQAAEIDDITEAIYTLYGIKLHRDEKVDDKYEVIYE